MSIDQRNITATLRQMSDPALQQFAQMNQENPYLFPLAFQESQDRKMLRSQTQAQGAQQPPVKEQALMAMAAPPTPPQGAPMPQGQMPPTQMAADGGYMSSQLPEDVGIGALPVRGMNFAEGGIVAFAGGGYNEAGDAGRLEILEQEMRAAQQRLSRGDTRAQGDIDSLTREIGRIKNPGASIAKKITSALPLGSAQAAPIQATPIQAAQPAAAPAQVASTDDGTVYDPMTGVPIYQGTPTTYEESPGKILKQIASPVVKGVTKAAKFITSAPKTEAEIAEEREPFSTGEYRGKSGDVEEDIRPAAALSPAQKKPIIDAAKATVPPEERRATGFTGEDWLNMGLAMMAGESPYAMQNIGKAGVATLAARQTREKAEYDRRKTEADIKGTEATAKYHTAAANRYALEDKPTAQYLKAVDAELVKLVAPNNMTYHMASPAEKQRMEQEARDRVLRTYSANYPELADTMGGGGFKVLGSRASP